MPFPPGPKAGPLPRQQVEERWDQDLRVFELLFVLQQFQDEGYSLPVRTSNVLNRF